MSKLITKLCPGCSGEAGSSFTVNFWKNGFYLEQAFYHCNNCGGIFTDKPVQREAALKVVNLGTLTDQHIDPEDMRYFDIEYINAEQKVDRVHGWYNTETHDVIQYG